jgi:DNA repair protein RecN (Recombination protein N)
MVGMGMGEEGGIEPGNPFPKALAPEIGRRIDHEVEIRGLDQKRGPGPVITGVCRPADRAIAPDDGDPVGGPGSEKGEIERRHGFSEKAKAVILPAMPAMLRSLRIRNLALVEELEWELSPGFTAVTGETGAGKSVILGALKFLLGERADRGVVRAGAANAGIEAVFTLDDTAGIDALLEESGVDPCQDGELILKRTIAAEGNGRQFVNGSACNLSVLKELGTLLVDLHGPHDHQSLFSRPEQTLLLDRFSEALPERDTYQACRAELAKARRELEDLLATSGGEEREARLREEVDEIRSANLTEGEEETLQSRYRAASDSRRLIELAAAGVARLEDEEHGVLSGVADTARLLKDLGRLDERAQPYLDRLEKISTDLDSLISDLRDHAEAIELDASELRNLEERVNLLATLRRKYGPSLAEVIARGERSAGELERLSSLTEETEKARVKVREAESKLRTAAAALGAKRKKGVKKLSSQVAGELSDLGFRQAGFEISLEDLPEPGPDGAEVAEFLFSPNPGEPPRPLRSIASSGEISRVMLALKTALAGQDRIPLLVFDEIDANVGGEIATRVAVKMAELGKGHQVLCITHLPQVAASASTQFLVSKEVRDSRTETTLLPVAGEARVAEISRMLGGATESALAHARTLLSGGSPAKTPKRTRG